MAEEIIIHELADFVVATMIRENFDVDDATEFINDLSRKIGAVFDGSN